LGLYRFILAMSVALGHLGFVFAGINGTVAVQIFYMISGFYMALVLNEKYIGAASSFKLFISNRFIRLYPNYLIVLLLNILVSLGVFLLTDGAAAAKMQSYLIAYRAESLSITEALCIFLFNFSILGWDWFTIIGYDSLRCFYFTADTFSAQNPALYKFLLVPQSWTLNSEFVFYLLAPFLLRGKKKLVFVIICICLIIKIVGHYYYHLSYESSILHFTYVEILFFCMGGVSYHYFYQAPKLQIPSLYSYLLCSGLLLFTVGWNWLPNTDFKYYFYCVYAFICVPILFKISNSKIDKYLGELSYPLYISHIFVGMILGIVHLSNSLFVILISLLLFSIVLYELVDKPIYKYKQKKFK
jgi:peptidoglycan/LPS O-acetylase OafA/YrhL